MSQIFTGTPEIHDSGIPAVTTQALLDQLVEEGFHGDAVTDAIERLVAIGLEIRDQPDEALLLTADEVAAVRHHLAHATTLRSLWREAAALDRVEQLERTIKTYSAPLTDAGESALLTDVTEDEPLSAYVVGVLRFDAFPAPATSLPCPSWCELPAGHPFDGWAGGNDNGSLDVVRAHSAEFPHGGPDQPSDLSLVRMEEAAAPGVGPVEWLPAEIVIEVRNNVLTGPQARELAVALVVAADAWDAATS